MEEILGVACCGTYDEGNGMAESVVRVKAIRLAVLRYMLLMQQRNQCGCIRCENEQAYRLETEP